MLTSNAILADRNATMIRELLNKQEITSANVNDLHGVWNHEQLRARERFENIEIPNGSAEVLKSPFHISNWNNQTGGIPALNDHDEKTIAQIIARGEAR